MADEVNLLTDEVGRVLVAVARVSLVRFVRERVVVQPDWAQLPTAVQQPGATFITLRHLGQLRGCIGNVVEEQPLAESVVLNTIGAASRDPRFAPVTRHELADIEVEVTVLTPLRPLAYTDYADLLTKIRPGVDGVMLQWGKKRGVLLPQVWERVRETADFLAAITQKAGIPHSKLQTFPLAVEAFVFQVQHFG